MNKERLLKVADEIERLPHKFNMLKPHSPYGSQQGSIAGFARGIGRLPNTLEVDKFFDIPLWQERQLSTGGIIWYKYAQELGIPFYPGLRMVRLTDIKPEHAVTLLRNLASGKWSFDEEKQ